MPIREAEEKKPSLEASSLPRREAAIGSSPASFYFSAIESLKALACLSLLTDLRISRGPEAP
jgi:hypothetical protein